jgi:hypothetical protein
MSFLLRRTRRIVWVGQERSRELAVVEFARTDEDADGLSVFEVENDEQRQLIVAAIACERKNVGRVDMIEIERDVIERYGPVAQTPEKGTTPVPAANLLHRSLDWDPATLQRMAEDLFDAGTRPREFATLAVRAAVRTLDAAAVVGESTRVFVRVEQARRSPGG